uniref:Uncharacterized protein n=1 Tax=Anopheles darlingi TaxID=43151 RepID=A0A2M4DI68_ANODA
MVRSIISAGKPLGLGPFGAIVMIGISSCPTGCWCTAWQSCWMCSWARSGSCVKITDVGVHPLPHPMLLLDCTTRC